MCSPNFSCLLCCNESFENINLLKNHIANVIKNLCCPVCKNKFDKISDLTLHLDQECIAEGTKDSTVFESVNSEGKTIGEKNNLIDDFNNLESDDSMREKNEDEGDTAANIEEEDSIREMKLEDNDIDFGNSILAKTLISKRLADGQYSVSIEDEVSNDAENGTIENSENLVENSGESQFFCQLCNMGLESIEDHLENYHAGQEVLVQPECVVEMELPEIEVTQVVEGSGQSSDETGPPVYILGTSEIPETEEKQPQIQELESNYAFKETAETIAEEECVDKDGRIYTRKVVKIGKFWNQPSNGRSIGRREPIIEKFIIDDDGKPRKITDEEEEMIEDQNSIITLHICPICHLQYSEIQNFYSHNCNMNAAKRYICSECDSEFYGPRALCAHMKLHSKSKPKQAEKPTKTGPFNCEYCGTQFRSYKSLQLHTRMHDPIKKRQIDPPVSYDPNGTVSQEDSGNNFTCPLCNKTFDKRYEAIHMNSHNGTILNFDCDICNRKLYTQANLDMHMKAHTNSKKFACSYCKKPFVTFDALNVHLSQQCQKRQYECRYCGRRFARPHEKVKHERIHTGEKPHNCEVCGKSFRVSYCLTLHMRTHSGMRPYGCEICGKRFKSHSVYNHHLLTHSKERNYKCPFCPKAFKTSVQLAGHKNSHIKPFTCTECNRPFASLYAVRTHMETHKRNNNLKFDCVICGASYARTFALRDHMKEQHANETDKIPQALLQSEEEEINATATILSVGEEEILMDIGGSNNAEQIATIEAIAH